MSDTHAHGERKERWSDWPDSHSPGDGEPEFKPLTRAEAQALGDKLPRISPLRVVLMQAVAGLVVAGVTWGVTGNMANGWSALYGAAAVVVPQALMARGLSRQFRVSAGTAAFGFLIWEFVKLLLTIGLLAAAPVVVADLRWPALLVGLIVTLKASWLVLLQRHGPTKKRGE